MSTSAIQRALPAAALAAALATAQIFPNLATPSQACILICPGSGRLEQKLFKVRASGNFTTGGAFTFLPSLYAAIAIPGSPLVAANWSLIAAGTAATVTSASAGWMIEAKLMFDTLSGKLQGTFDSNVANAPVAAAVITNPLTGLNGQSEPVMYFAAGVTFGTANAGNSSRMGDFCLDA